VKIFILLMFLFSVGCSHLALVKECKQVEDTELYACRLIKPWE